MSFINQLVSALFQLLVLILIPFVWYVIRDKKILGFFKWMGLQRSSKTPLKEMAIIFLGFLAVMALPYIALYRSGSLTYSGFVFDSYSQSGWSLQTVTVILIWSIIQTSLSEEIFFRGFLCKRLINKYGFHVGNFIHALLFGCMHILAVLGKGILANIIVIFLTGGVGYALGWLMKEKANGSILYGWCIHACVNILSSILILSFLIS